MGGNPDEDDSLLRAVAASPPLEPPARAAVALPPETAIQQHETPEIVDTSAFALTPLSLRFANAQMEVDYRAWHMHKAVPFQRAGLVAALLSWLIGLLAWRLARLDGFGRLAEWRSAT